MCCVTVMFLILFEIYSSGTMLWSSTGIDGVQLLVVGLAFLGLIIVCARESAADPETGMTILRLLLGATAIGVVIYWYVAYNEPKLGEGTDDLINPRPFALFAMSVVAAALACWRSESATPGQQWLALIWAGITTLTVALSMSRTALVCCAALFPLAIVLRLNFKSLVQAGMMLLAGGVVFVGAVLSYKPLYDRFFWRRCCHQGRRVFTQCQRGGPRSGMCCCETSAMTGCSAKEWHRRRFLVRHTFKGLIGQPHNDYLRFYFDTGLVGLNPVALLRGGVLFADDRQLEAIGCQPEHRLRAARRSIACIHRRLVVNADR